jgi:hypothetical protein
MIASSRASSMSPRSKAISSGRPRSRNTARLPRGRKLFYTVRVDPGLADKLKEHGVTITGVGKRHLQRALDGLGAD